jgi:hypothetical protein
MAKEETSNPALQSHGGQAVQPSMEEETERDVAAKKGRALSKPPHRKTNRRPAVWKPPLLVLLHREVLKFATPLSYDAVGIEIYDALFLISVFASDWPD